MIVRLVAGLVRFGILVAVLVGCRPPASGPVVGAPVEPVVVAPVAAPAPSGPSEVVPAAAPAHPGTVAFLDRDTGVHTVTPVAELPESIAWAMVGDVKVPVVRVESTAAGGRREIFRYGADGALLDTTVAGP